MGLQSLRVHTILLFFSAQCEAGGDKWLQVPQSKYARPCAHMAAARSHGLAFEQGNAAFAWRHWQAVDTTICRAAGGK
jgi:hypothetical protein